jgi:hypothetical protein
MASASASTVSLRLNPLSQFTASLRLPRLDQYRPGNDQEQIGEKQCAAAKISCV